MLNPEKYMRLGLKDSLFIVKELGDILGLWLITILVSNLWNAHIKIEVLLCYFLSVLCR